MRILYMDCFLGFDASMLLGALIDAGANPEKIEEMFKTQEMNISLLVKTTTRSAITCKKAVTVAGCDDDIKKAEQNEFVSKIFNKYESSEGTDAKTVLAALYALEQLEIDYVMSSEVSLGDMTDGTVLNILNDAGTEIFPSDRNGKPMQPADAAFLAEISNESGPKPKMQILSIGYGAGGINADEPDIVNAIIGEFDGDNLIEMSYEQELVDML